MAASRVASSLRGAQLVPSLTRLLVPQAWAPAEAFASAGSSGHPQTAPSEALPAWSQCAYSGGAAARTDVPESHTLSSLVHRAASSSEGAYCPRSTRSLHSSSAPEHMHATTVLCVRRDNTVVIIGDGQVTLGSQIMKPNVRKVRRLGEGKKVIAGFAGAAADGFTLFERLESRIDEFPGQLTRAAVELAKAWRTDKFLRRLDAVMVVADDKVSLMLSGNGDVLEPHDGIIGIGSGGAYALSAARALIDIPDYDAERIARKAMQIAADTCIYTNSNFTMEKIDGPSQ